MSDSAATAPQNLSDNQTAVVAPCVWIGLAAGTAAIGALFQSEVTAAVRTWIDSTAYNHCALVIPIALYLIRDRIPALRGLAASPYPAAALLALPIAAAWLAAERLGIMEGRQLAVVSFFEVLCLAMLGPRLFRAVLGPLLYLYFLVPFGEFLTPRLQDITAWFIGVGIGFLGFPAYIDGYIIEIPEGVFHVAEACAGLRFLIASIAFGALYAILMYRSPVRRAAFIAVSIVVPIVANGFRALGIVWLGHILGSAEAAAADHLVYGWVFFSFVILLLTFLGLPFREDTLPEAAAGPPMVVSPNPLRLALASGLATAAIAAAAPLAVAGLNTPPSIAAGVLHPIDLGSACAASGPASPVPGVEGTSLSQRVVCGGLTLTVRVDVFSRRATAAPINTARRRLTRAPDSEDVTETPLAEEFGPAARGWRLVRSNKPAFVAATALWIDGEQALPGMAMRLKLARTSLTGLSQNPVLVTLTPSVDWAAIDVNRRKDLEVRLSRIVGNAKTVDAQARSIGGAAR